MLRLRIATLAALIGILAPAAALADETTTPEAVTEPAAPPAGTDPARAPTEIAPAAAPAPQKSLYDRIDAVAFVDAYYSVNFNRPRPAAAANRYHAFDPNTGFGLAWFGADASLAPEPIGGAVGLRFGPSVPNLALADFPIPGGIGFLQQAFVAYRPGGSDGPVTLTLGKFDTIYGHEVAQSHLNINYTRGLLYNLAQPFFHTGLRADVQVARPLVVRAMVVNGWNNTVDNNRGKSLGLQAAVTPVETLTVSLGYLGGPEQADTGSATCAPGTEFDGATNACSITAAGAPGGAVNFANRGANSRWRHLVDLIADLKPIESLHFVVNADYVTDKIVDPATGGDKAVSWYGASALARVGFSKTWGLGLRGEVIRDPDAQISAPNAKAVTILTGTVTVEAAVTKYLLIRLDNRLDSANEDVFPKGLNGAAGNQLTSTMGVVAKTN